MILFEIASNALNASELEGRGCSLGGCDNNSIIIGDNTDELNADCIDKDLIKIDYQVSLEEVGIYLVYDKALLLCCLSYRTHPTLFLRLLRIQGREWC